MIGDSVVGGALTVNLCYEISCLCSIIEEDCNYLLICFIYFIKNIDIIFNVLTDFMQPLLCKTFVK